MPGFYLILILVSILYLLSSFTITKKNQMGLYLITCILLCVLAAIQDVGVGPDTMNYCKGFESISKLSLQEILSFRWEKGYVLLNKLISLLCHSSRALICVMAMFIEIPFFLWIKRESVSPMLSLVVFVAFGFWSSSLYVYRQWCAMAILTISYKHIKERKLLPFLLTVLIAMSFHRTAVFFLPLYFIYYIKIDRKLLFTGVAVSALLAMTGDSVLSILNRFARIPAEKSANGGMVLLCVLWVFVFIFYWIERDNLSKAQLKLPFLMLFVAAVIQPIVFTFSLWSRIVLYFRVAFVLVIPILYRCIYRLIIEIFENCKYQGLKSIVAKADSRFLSLITSVFVCCFLIVWYYMTDDGLQYAVMSLAFN